MLNGTSLTILGITGLAVGTAACVEYALLGPYAFLANVAVCAALIYSGKRWTDKAMSGMQKYSPTTKCDVHDYQPTTYKLCSKCGMPDTLYR